jgi:aminopeptidase N
MLALLPASIILALAQPVAPLDRTPAAQTTTQLPTNVRPSHYDLSLFPDAEHLRFRGHAGIDIEVLVPGSTLTFNARDLVFTRARLTGKNVNDVGTVAVDAASQTATVRVPKAVDPGPYRLELDYTGTIGTVADGLFALDYDADGAPHRALYTQFENSSARKMFPSWDEPAYKATFTLDVTAPASLMAVSNTPVASRTVSGNTMHVSFASTPKMSTYLVFFSLGDFERATTKSGSTEIGVVTRRGKTGQAAFALESSRAVIEQYNQYFGTPFPLPKLDNVAAPGQSQFFGAMENWGAIFSFESLFLLDPTISTEADRQQVFQVAAHEIAHQWFGDLVTMRWWDDLWLNEGFASWLTTRTTARLHPEWHTELQAVSIREAAMNGDAVASTHPVVQHIENADQASQAFDFITYSKGETVIRMLESHVGADVWQRGVSNYIREHAYGNAVTDDLWREVDAVSQQPVTGIAHDFTLQPGVPLIRVTDVTCTAGRTSLSFDQDEFTRDRPNKVPLRWHVPVIASVLGHAPASTVVDGRGSLDLDGCGPVVVNSGQNGYFRTEYNANTLQSLTKAFASLPPIDQMGLLADNWALSMAGHEPVDRYLDLTRRIPADALPQVWQTLSGELRLLGNYVRGDAAGEAALRRFAAGRLGPVLGKIGWTVKNGEAPAVDILRNSLIGTLSELGDTATIAEARRRLEASARDPTLVPGSLRKTIAGVVARHADAPTWDELHARAKLETSPLVRQQLYAQLAVVEDEALTRQALELALTAEPGPTNSAAMVNLAATLHPDVVFAFATQHKSEVDRFIDPNATTRFYPGLAGRSSDVSILPALHAFAEQFIPATSRVPVANAEASVRFNAKVKAERIPAVVRWLSAQ